MWLKAFDWKILLQESIFQICSNHCLQSIGVHSLLLHCSEVFFWFNCQIQSTSCPMNCSQGQAVVWPISLACIPPLQKFGVKRQKAKHASNLDSVIGDAFSTNCCWTDLTELHIAHCQDFLHTSQLPHPVQVIYMIISFLVSFRSNLSHHARAKSYNELHRHQEVI